MDFVIWGLDQALFHFHLSRSHAQNCALCNWVINVTIKLANKVTIFPIGIVSDVEVLCGKVKYPTDFLILGTTKDEFCPIGFGRPFFNTRGAVIDCKREKVMVKF